MTLRCKDGDIAVITWDYPNCLSNIGRLVQVRGPVRNHPDGPSWSIKPVTPELYAVREGNGSVTRERVAWKGGVCHPDSWMLPIRPEPHAQGQSETAGLELASQNPHTEQAQS